MNSWVDRLEQKARRVRQRVDAARAASRGRHPGERSRRDDELVAPDEHGPPVRQEDPPVVARLIVEIRSDGTRTVARGALEDVLTGERSTIEASGGSPVQLAASMASTLLSTPLLLGRSVGALVKARLARGAKP